jgi:hypothetical protein
VTANFLEDAVAHALEGALLVYADQHRTTSAAVLDSVAGPEPRDVVLRDHPVLTLTSPPPDSAPGSLRLVWRGTMPLAPHLDAYVRLETLLHHTPEGEIDHLLVTAGTLEATLEKEDVWVARLGGRFDSGDAAVFAFRGALQLLTLGFTIDVAAGFPTSGAAGFFLEGRFVAPVSLPLAFTAGTLGAVGLMVVVAQNFAPRVHEDDASAGTLASPVSALDYVKWVTGPFLDHPEDAWVFRPDAVAFGAGLILESFPDRGNLLGLDPAGLLILAGPDGDVLVLGAAGEVLKSPKFKAAAFAAFQIGRSFAVAAQVSIEVPGASDSSGVHTTPRAATPVSPGTTDPAPSEPGADAIFKGEGALNLYVPTAPGMGAAHFELGTPHEPVTLVFLKQIGEHGLCQAEFFLVVDGATGTTFGFSLVAGFAFGGHDDIFELALHLELSVYGIFANAPYSFEGRFDVGFDFRIRVLFLKAGVDATAYAIAMSDPKKLIFDLSLHFEVPWPLPEIELHANLPVLDDPLPPEFNPPMLVGSYVLGS